MSWDRLKEILDLAKRTPADDFGSICPGWFFYVNIPGREGLDDELEFHTEVLNTAPYYVDPQKREFPKQNETAAEEEPGNYVYEIKKSANNGWLEWIALGRARNNDVILRHQSVSKLHARIHKEYGGEKTGLGEELWITDMNSSTGTWVNSVMLKPSEPRKLSTGDTVRFGQVECEFLSGKALHEAMIRTC